MVAESDTEREFKLKRKVNLRNDTAFVNEFLASVASDLNFA